MVLAADAEDPAGVVAVDETQRSRRILSADGMRLSVRPDKS
jgi:hypothetical protein